MMAQIKRAVNVQNVAILMHADDMVLLSSNPANLQVASGNKKAYAIENAVINNGSITKGMTFKREQKVGKAQLLHLQGRQYGKLFHSSIWEQCCKQMVQHLPYMFGTAATVIQANHADLLCYQLPQQ
jgi:hypothetical protein